MLIAIVMSWTWTRSPIDCLQTIASWGGRADSRCAISAALLSLRTGDEWSAEFSLIGAERLSAYGAYFDAVVSDREGAEEFWLAESRLSVSEQAMIDDLAAERRSGLLAERS